MKEQRQKFSAVDTFMFVMSTVGLAIIALVTAPVWSAIIWGL